MNGEYHISETVAHGVAEWYKKYQTHELSFYEHKSNTSLIYESWFRYKKNKKNIAQENTNALWRNTNL